MSNADAKLREWHQKFGVPILINPAFPGRERADLRVKLINEEAREFQDAADCGDLIEMADALADLLYVVYGAALECGIPLDAGRKGDSKEDIAKAAWYLQREIERLSK